MRKLPVFIINGFLESGKTKMICDVISKDGFNKKGSTLVISFEEGIEEYDDRDLLNFNTLVVHLTQEELNHDKLDYYCDLYDPDRIIIEMNSMFDKSNLTYPEYFAIQQEITMVDSNTFTIYYNNMRQMFAEMVKTSDVVFFNRCKSLEPLSGYRMNIKAINKDCEVVFEDINNKTIDTLPEDYPYDMTLNEIEINDVDFGFFYLDCNDQIDKYVEKKVTFKGFALTSDELPKNHFIIGRLAMTCCANDISLLGFEVVNNIKIEIKQKDWYKVTAIIKNEYSIALEDQGPVLYIERIEKIEEIKDSVLDFNK